MNFKYTLLFAIITIIFVISSCKTKQLVFNNRKSESAVADILDSCKVKELHFDTFVGKFKANFKKGDKDQTVQGNIRIKKDSLIWMSISPGMGIEVARVLLSVDSVKFIDRFGKKYYNGDYSFIRAKLGIEIDFNTIYSILTNKVFVYPLNKGISVEKDYQLMAKEDGYLLNSSFKASNSDNNMLSQYVILPEIYRPKMMKIDELDKNRGVNLSYSDFNLVENQTFPERIIFKFYNQQNKFELDIDFQKYFINKKSNFNFRIPNGYSAIDK